jgi:lysophospholipase
MEIIKELTYRESMENEVLPYIEKRKTEAFFEGSDGIKLHYVAYKCDDPQRSIAIIHGFTESAEKYREMIWYFLKSGSDVYIYDQRCHGKSERLVENKTITHVDRFEDYVNDFEIFTEKIIPKNMPLMLYSHSMGGAVAALYLQNHPDIYQKAVFSSPMIAPERGGFPKFTAKAVCKTAMIFGKAKKKLFISGDYPGKEEFETSCAISFERFSFYEQLKRITPVLQNYSPTYGWTYESLKVTDKILKKGEPEKIVIPVMLFNDGLDVMVRKKEQIDFASRMKNCEFITVDKAKHEIFLTTDDIMHDYVNRIIDFFSSNQY